MLAYVFVCACGSVFQRKVCVCGGGGGGGGILDLTSYQHRYCFWSKAVMLSVGFLNLTHLEMCL